MEKTVAKTKGEAIWILLATYILLLSFTGYIAFFDETYSPSRDPTHIAKVNNIPEDAKQIFYDGMKQATEDDKKKRELAFQSFNIVLGALLGFLSAVYVSTLRSENTSNAGAMLRDKDQLIKLAIKMKSKGIDLHNIVEICGLTKERIRPPAASN